MGVVDIEESGDEAAHRFAIELIAEREKVAAAQEALQEISQRAHWYFIKRKLQKMDYARMGSIADAALGRLLGESV